MFTIQIDGTDIDGIVWTEIRYVGGSRPSTFSFGLSASSRAASLLLQWGTGAIAVSFFLLDESGLPILVFSGYITHISFDAQASAVHVFGLDGSYIMMQRILSESYVNRSAGEIAAMVAERHGFQTNISSGKEFIGPYDGQDRVQVSLDQYAKISSEWSLLRYLSQRENLIFWMDQSLMNFCPTGEISRSRWAISVGSSDRSVFSRHVQFAESIAIGAKSWNSWECQTSTIDSFEDGAVGTSSTPISELVSDCDYVIVEPNLTYSETAVLADALRTRVRENELEARITITSDPKRKLFDFLCVSGTDTVFDTNYLIRSITRRYNAKIGLMDEIMARAPIGGFAT